MIEAVKESESESNRIESNLQFWWDDIMIDSFFHSFPSFTGQSFFPSSTTVPFLQYIIILSIAAETDNTVNDWLETSTLATSYACRQAVNGFQQQNDTRQRWWQQHCSCRHNHHQCCCNDVAVVAVVVSNNLSSYNDGQRSQRTTWFSWRTSW